MKRKNIWARFAVAIVLSLPLTACKDAKTLQENEQFKTRTWFEARKPVSVFHCEKREVWNMKTFEVQFRYQDRNEGTAESTVKVEASSLPEAVGKATREFVKGLDRKQRFDMNKNGLE